MAIATGSQHSLHYVAESTYGTTPATPTWKPMCITGVNLGLTRDAIESGCLSSDRQVKDVRNGNKQLGGGVDSEIIYEEADDWLEAALMGTWTANVLKAGTTRRSFTIERGFNGLDTPEYHRSAGVELSGFDISLAPNSLATITYNTLGQSLTVATAQVPSSTYNPMTTNAPFDSFTGSITEGGSAVAVVTQMDLSLDNGMEPTFVLFDDETIRPTDGKSRITGTLTAYYEDSTLYNKFVNGTNSAIVFTMTDPAGNDYEFNFPNIKYTGGNPDVSGDGPVTLALEFSAIYDATEASQIVITRTAA